MRGTPNDLHGAATAVPKESGDQLTDASEFPDSQVGSIEC